MNGNSSLIDHFTKNAGVYDEHNRPLAPIADSLHLLIRLILKNAPERSRVLCVGVGTGSEILSLASAFPKWTFVGIDPSSGMLDVCRERLRSAGVLNRTELINGYVSDVPQTESFDAALSILVAHFLKREERLNFYQAICARLIENGILINAEISYDLNSPEFMSMLNKWEAVQLLMGATPESLADMPRVLREMLSVITPGETENLLIQSGISMPVRFFQAFMISGWYGRKDS